MAGISSLGVGSGLDLSSLLDSLRESEQSRLQPIRQKISSTNSQLSSFGQLQDSLEKFQGAVQKLNDPGLYEGFKATASGSGVSAEAGSTAAAGRYDVKVTQLAQAQSLATKGQAADATFGTGTLSLSVGQGQSVDIEINDQNNSLEGIRDSINAAGAGVTASVVNDGDPANPFRLVLSSEETGTDATMNFSTSAGSSAALSDLFARGPGQLEETVSAQNANLTINGLSITSQSNTVEEAIQGVTLTLDSTAEGASSRIEVNQDSGSVKDAIKGFVSAYNSLEGRIDSLTKVSKNDDGEVSGGALTGNSTVRSIQSTMRSAMSARIDEGGMNYLFEAGISFDEDGKLQIEDEAKLDQAVADNMDGLRSLFTGNGETTGITTQLDASIESLLRDNGAIDSARSGLQSSVDRLNARSERVQESIDQTVARYEAQFQQLDRLMSEMNSTQSYLAQQFESMNQSSD